MGYIQDIQKDHKKLKLLWVFYEVILKIPFELLCCFFLILSSENWGEGVKGALVAYITYKLTIYPILVFLPVCVYSFFEIELLGIISAFTSLFITPFIHGVITVVSIITFDKWKNQNYTWAIFSLVFAILLFISNFVIQIPVFCIFIKPFLFSIKGKNESNKQTQNSM